VRLHLNNASRNRPQPKIGALAAFEGKEGPFDLSDFAQCSSSRPEAHWALDAAM
jgi:hypothetical protein